MRNIFKTAGDAAVENTAFYGISDDELEGAYKRVQRGRSRVMLASLLLGTASTLLVKSIAMASLTGPGAIPVVLLLCAIPALHFVIAGATEAAASSYAKRHESTLENGTTEEIHKVWRVAAARSSVAKSAFLIGIASTALAYTASIHTGIAALGPFLLWAIPAMHLAVLAVIGARYAFTFLNRGFKNLSRDWRVVEQASTMVDRHSRRVETHMGSFTVN